MKKKNDNRGLRREEEGRSKKERWKERNGRGERWMEDEEMKRRVKTGRNDRQ